ncbi:MAG: elongation factor Ts [Gammaproteobacteria bacterium]|nr:elongation factor Ts [Gammaproteobacteria bacterium]
MPITATLVKELRERTGAGLMECKQALVESAGDVEHAIELMRRTGQIKAAKKAGRIATEGAIFIQQTPHQAVMLEINCETDFVANEASFKSFGEKVARSALSHPHTDLEQLKNLPVEQNASTHTVEQARQELILRCGENIQIRRGVLIKTQGEGEAIYTYLHGKKIGVLVRLSAGSSMLGSNIAMHIAACNPEVLNPEDVSEKRLEKEKKILQAQVEKESKPAAILQKILQGRLKKFTHDISLNTQEFVKDPSKTVGEILKEGGAHVIQFVRYELGEKFT